MRKTLEENQKGIRDTLQENQKEMKEIKQMLAKLLSPDENIL